MKRVIAAIFVLFALTADGFSAASTVTLVAEVYQTKRTTAAPFLQGDHVDPNEFVAAMRKHAQGFHSTTTITRLPAITVMNGQRSVVEGKDTVLEVQPVLAPDNATVTVNAVLRLGEKRLTTSGHVKIGGALFLGALDGSNQDSVQLVFITALRHP